MVNKIGKDIGWLRILQTYMLCTFGACPSGNPHSANGVYMLRTLGETQSSQERIRLLFASREGKVCREKRDQLTLLGD